MLALSLNPPNTRKGIATDPKIEAVKSFPMPKSVKESQVLYWADHILLEIYSQLFKSGQTDHYMTSPRKGVKLCEYAFKELKTLLIKTLVLAFPDFELPFVLETDASGA